MLERNKNRIFKSIKRKDYERKLFQQLIEYKYLDVKEIIRKYWDDLYLENENMRFGEDMPRAFQDLAKIFGYKNFECREGSIAHVIQEDGVTLADPNVVNKKIMDFLKSIQQNLRFPVVEKTDFPNLPNLSEDEVDAILEGMASGKALAHDLFSDVIFSEAHVHHVKSLIGTLWNKKTLDGLDPSHFHARLITLNKKHPDVPNASEIRPIIVMSPLFKLLEARVLPKLRRSWLIISQVLRLVLFHVWTLQLTSREL